MLQKSSHSRGFQGPSREGESHDWPAGPKGTSLGRLSSEALDPVRARGAEQAEVGAGHPLGLVPGFGVDALKAGAVGYSHCWAVGRKGLF